MSLLLFFLGCFCAGEMDSGMVKGLALAFEMDFWGVPKFMNSGFRIVGIIWYYITRIPAVNCICSTSLVNLQGPMSPCSLNGCGPAVLFPHGSCVCTCLHSLQDVYRRVSGVYLSHSVRLRLEGNISATFAAQLCHQHVPETERPDL